MSRLRYLLWTVRCHSEPTVQTENHACPVASRASVGNMSTRSLLKFEVGSRRVLLLFLPSHAPFPIASSDPISLDNSHRLSGASIKCLLIAETHATFDGSINFDTSILQDSNLLDVKHCRRSTPNACSVVPVGT